MTGCAEPGSRVWLSHSERQTRRYAWTWELVESAAGTLVGIHTGRSNHIVGEALAAGLIPEFRGYTGLRREARYPESRRRADFLLETEEGSLWLEVKNVTAAVSGRRAVFPDAVSTRATEHLRALAARCEAGDRAALIYCVQRDDVDEVAPAAGIDPAYAGALEEAAQRGVRVLAYGASVSPRRIELTRRLRVAACAG